MGKLDEVLQRFAEKEVDSKILIVGQTGAGKTTILNYLARFAETADLTVKDMTRGHIHSLIHGHVADQANEGASGKSSGMSQTAKPVEYSIPITTKSGHTLTLIVLDTPGFADTAGVEVDKAHENHIVELVNQQNFLTCVLFVISGATTRIHPTTKYTMATITALMPRDILGNVIIVHTFVDCKEKCKFPDKELQDCFEVAPKKFFLENPLALVMGFEEKSGKDSALIALDRIDWDKDEDDDDDGEDGRTITRTLKKSNAVMVRLLDAVANFKAYPTNTIVELKGHKDTITSGLLELSWAIKSEFDLQKSIQEAELRMEQKKVAKDVYQEKWVLKDCDTFHYYCEHTGCALGDRPCCFQMAAGHGEYEHRVKTVIFAILTLGWRRRDPKLVEDLEKAERVGKESAAAEVFNCPCKHPISEHLGGQKEWVCERTLVVALADLNPDEDVSAATAKLREKHVQSEAEMIAIGGRVKAALEGYGRLGLPRALENLLLAQKKYYEELINSEKGDKRQLEDMIKDVELMQGQLREQS